MPDKNDKQYDENQIKFYGRRKGKPLANKKILAVETVIPQVRIQLPDDGMIDPVALFGFTPDAIWLEIGFGAGEHLFYQAEQNPHIGMIGCEPFINGTARLCTDIMDHNTKNIRIWDNDARLLLSRLPDQSIDRLFLLNADPWPKTRHHKRRFIQTDILDNIHRILKTGGQFRMSTDHPKLAVWELDKTYHHGGFEWMAHCADDWRHRPDDLPETRYQKKGLREGRDTVFLDFKAL